MFVICYKNSPEKWLGSTENRAHYFAIDLQICLIKFLMKYVKPTLQLINLLVNDCLNTSIRIYPCTSLNFISTEFYPICINMQLQNVINTLQLLCHLLEVMKGISWKGVSHFFVLSLFFIHTATWKKNVEASARNSVLTAHPPENGLLACVPAIRSTNFCTSIISRTRSCMKTKADRCVTPDLWRPVSNAKLTGWVALDIKNKNGIKQNIRSSFQREGNNPYSFETGQIHLSHCRDVHSHPNLFYKTEESNGRTEEGTAGTADGKYMPAQVSLTKQPAQAELSSWAEPALYW